MDVLEYGEKIRSFEENIQFEIGPINGIRSFEVENLIFKELKD